VIAYRLLWDSRCADCRALLMAGSTGYRVQNRLLCQECSADVEWTEAESANHTRTTGTTVSPNARSRAGRTSADWAASPGLQRGIRMDRSRGRP
jgi:hypothetical protein